MYRRHFCFCVLIAYSVVIALPAVAQNSSLGYVAKLGVDVDVRSALRMLADDILSGNVVLPELGTPIVGVPAVPQIQLRGGNQQVSDAALDYVQIFAGFRPFVHAVQSEVSAAAFGRNVVVTYNNSAGFHVAPNPNGPGLVLDRSLFSGYSVSNDGGKTWMSAYMPLAPDGTETLGDPSVGVDRLGNFYFAGGGVTTEIVGTNQVNTVTIQVNQSTDGGNTFGQAVVVQKDNGADKPWLAVGPDPVFKSRDNVYVTWTSFQFGACELRFGRSKDRGVTWTSKTIFVPTPDSNPTHPQNCLQYSNPVVDSITGTLYVPFLRFSNSDQDFIQMLISNDGGETFRFATFNFAGAPDATVMPVTQPGALTSCGGGNIRLTIHTAANPGPGTAGFPRYINATRLTLQPALAARNDRLYLAWNNSTSLIYGDQTSQSNILFMSSENGGQTWTPPIVVNPLLERDIQHVLPALAIDNDPNDVHITYYTQHSNGTVDLDMANSHDGGASFPPDRTARVTSTSFDLPPSNIPLSNAPTFGATNYDRLVAVCYALGEYQSVTTANGNVYAAWGDARNLFTEPVNALNPISGQTHAEQDVFFQQLKAQ